MTTFKNDSFPFIAVALLCLCCPAISYGQSVAEPPSPKMLALQAELQALAAERDSVEQMLAISQSRLNEIMQKREQIIDSQNENGISGESYNKIIGNLQTMRVNLMIDLAGLEARRTVLLETSQQLSDGHNNEIIETLKEMLEIETQNYEQMQQLYKSGSISSVEVAQGRSRVLTARLRLSQAKSEQKGESNITADLLATSLERADKQARLDKTESLLDSLTKSRSLVGEEENLTASVALLRQQISAFETDAANLHQRVEQVKRHLKELDQ